MYRALLTAAVLFHISIGLSDGKKEENPKRKQNTSEHSATDAQTKEKADAPQSSSSGWSKYVYVPVITLFVALSVIVVFAFQLLFWPFFLAQFIIHEILILEDYHQSEAAILAFPWKAMALKLTCYFIIWTVAGVTLLQTQTRFQRKIWMAFRWTHAVSWWLFWGLLEFHVLGGLLIKWMGPPICGLPNQPFAFVMRPFLVAYLCSGAVCNTASALRMIKYVWDNDLTLS